MRFSPTLSVAVILLACHVNWSCCTTVEFYSGRNYSGFLEKKIVGKNDENACIKVNKYQIKSIKTDKCIILYETDNCKRKPKLETTELFYSIRVDKNTKYFDSNVHYYPQLEDVRFVGSFHVCGSMGGGPELDVDLYGQVNYHGAVVKSWRDVCKCENIPSFIVPGEGGKGATFSIDNHGNAMYVYDQEHCRGNSKFLPAGDSLESRAVRIDEGVRIQNYRSFRPSTKLNCIKLDASIYKFTFSNGSLHGGYREENVELASTQTLVNSGARSMKQAVHFSKTIGNTVEYSIAHAFTHVNSTNVTVGVEAEANASVPGVGGGKFKFDLQRNYQCTNSKFDTSLNNTSITESQTLKVVTAVTVNACEKCEVAGFIKVIRDFPINYTAEALVTGMAGDEKMSAEEIQRYLPAGMEFLKEFDEHSVQVSVEGKMRAEFAWETFVSKSCEPLHTCEHATKGNLGVRGAKTRESYAVPFVVEVDDQLSPSGGEFEIGVPSSTPGEFRESALSESTLF